MKRVLPLSLLLFTACIPMAPRSGSSSTGYAPGPTGSESGSESSMAAPAPGTSASAPAPAAPAPASPVSVTIRSACSKTVSVFYGDKPRFSSGTTSSISSNSVQSKSFQVGDQMWLLDDRGEGVGSTTISAGTRQIEISSNCAGLSAR